MDISKALTILQINKYNFNTTELKKAYLKQALLCHPDKIGNTPINTLKFQDLQESYNFLILYAEPSNDHIPTTTTTTPITQTPPTPSKENINLIDINTEVLKMFINNVLGGNYINTLIDILSGITDLSLLLSDSNISIETINKIKHFVKKYGINNERQKNTHELNIRDYILNPSIDDLLDDNIYKLSIDNEIYLVPLWHHECIYEDVNRNEIIVNCVPKLPNNIYIDDKNHIYTSISISLNNSLLNENYYINIGKKKYELPINNLYIKSSPQQICLYNCGILEINDSDFYNTSIRSNIYITITLI